jgi:YegS/Rv2252/BmrU family lipid kinase
LVHSSGLIVLDGQDTGSETSAVRACVIFNPAAKGQKAERFRRCLDMIAAECSLERTAAPGDARALAAEAIRRGFETIFAAGGDGTLNEVLNGFADVPDGFARARLGVLPLGTVNVFARGLGIPTQPDAAWQVLRCARETRIDLPCVEHGAPNERKRRFFAQMAGAGLDARAIELVSWSHKKKIGPLAYVIAGLRALTEKPARITVTVEDRGVEAANVSGPRLSTLDSRRDRGQMVLIGNGCLYGGSFRIFPGADACDGLLDVCIFPRANWLTLLWCALPLLLGKRLPESAVTRFRQNPSRCRVMPRCRSRWMANWPVTCPWFFPCNAPGCACWCRRK